MQFFANSNRSEDARLEGIVNEFLNKYYFNEGFEEVRWATEKRDQVAGIDVFLTSEKLGLDNAKVDIKSAVKYSDRYLGTYSLELSFIGRQYKEKIGWFINDELETEYYLLLYPKSTKHYTDIKTVDDIDNIEYYLVKKEALKDFFKSRGYDKERLLDVCANMREELGNGNNKLTWDSDSANFHFSLTGYLAEQPINAVVKRQVYDKYAIMKGKIEKK